MVYVLRPSYNAKQSASLDLTDESEAQMAAESLKYETEVLGHAVKRSFLPYTMGFKRPSPTTPLVFKCPIEASKFHNFMYSGAGILISQDIVELIEDMEPGVHQYFPVEFIMKSGPQPEQDYYILNVCTQLKSLDFEKGQVGKSPIKEDMRWYFQGKEYETHYLSNTPKFEPPYDLYVKKAVFEGHVLWHEHGVQAKTSIYVTDEFYSRALALGDLGSLDVAHYAGEV